MADTFSTSNKKGSVVQYEIYINGTMVPLTIQVDSIETSFELNKIPTATVKLTENSPDGSGKGSNKIELAKSVDVKPDYDFEIKLGTVSSKETVFKGVVRKVGTAAQGSEGATTYTIEGDHAAIKLTQSKFTKHHKDSTDKDVISKLLGPVLGSVKTQSGDTEKHECLTQYQTTDWDFVKARCEVKGMVLACTPDGKVDAVIPDFSDSDTFTYGIDIKDHDLSVNVDGVAKSAKVATWNPDTQSREEVTINVTDVPINGQGEDISKVAGYNGNPEINLQSAAYLPKKDLEFWGKAEVQRRALSRIQGSIQVDGNSGIKLNTCVKLQGVDVQHEGSAYVTKIEHHWAQNWWDSTIGFGTDSQSFQQDQSGGSISDPSAGGQMPGTGGGMKTAKVKKISGDPKSSYRILVEIQGADNVDTGHDNYWARLSQPHASNGFGMFILPEVGDEVLVQYLDNDPRNPVITGCVYSSKLPMPVNPDGGGDWDGQEDKNNIKGFFSSAGMRMQFREVDKIIQIDTPAGNVITLTEKDKSIIIKDENDNHIIMKPEGIDVYTPKDLTVKADMNIKIEAGQSIEVKSGMATKMEAGTTFDTKAGAANTMKGATCEVSGSAKTDVKGGMVFIN